MIPTLAASLAVIALVIWFFRGAENGLTPRVPGTDHSPGVDATAVLNPVLAGKRVAGTGQPSSLPGAWPEFRGVNRTNISAETTALARAWEPSGPSTSSTGSPGLTRWRC